jgi:hypothetical protein
VQAYWPADTDPETKVICVMGVTRTDLFYPATSERFFGVGNLDWEPECSTKFGQDKLLSDTAVAEWYAQQ